MRISIILAILGFTTGLISSWYWLKSSLISIKPKIDGRFGGAIATPGTPWISGTIEAFAKAGRLNRAAALWTAASVLLNAIAALFGAFSR